MVTLQSRLCQESDGLRVGGLGVGDTDRLGMAVAGGHFISAVACTAAPLPAAPRVTLLASCSRPHSRRTGLSMPTVILSLFGHILRQGTS